MTEQSECTNKESDVLNEIDRHNVLEKIIEELSRLIEKNEINVLESRN